MSTPSALAQDSGSQDFTQTRPAAWFTGGARAKDVSVAAAPSSMQGGSVAGGSDSAGLGGVIIASSTPPTPVVKRAGSLWWFKKTDSAQIAQTMKEIVNQAVLDKPNDENVMYATGVPYIDLNPYVRAYCDTLGVPIGSTYFTDWGCEIYPGQTGGQNDFGWRQDHKIPHPDSMEFDHVANGILANAGYRPTFYLDTFDAKRKGYGRPWTWIPDPVIDEILTESWYAPNGVMITGHDMQHFSLKFLAALAALPDENEKSEMAKAFLWRYASIVGGWLRTDFCKAGIYSSREVGRVLDFICDVANVGYMDEADAQAVIDWVEFTVIPKLPANGMGYINKPTDQGYKTEPNLGNVEYSYPWQDGLMVPGMWRFGEMLEKFGNDHQKQVGHDLRMKARKIAVHLATLITADGACPKAEGIDGQLSWVENEKYGYTVWCYRALRIAGAHAKADVVFQNYKDQPYWWPWFVEADGTWNKQLPMSEWEQ